MLPRSRFPRERDLNERERGMEEEGRDDSQTIFHFVDERWWISCSLARVDGRRGCFESFAEGKR